MPIFVQKTFLYAGAKSNLKQHFELNKHVSNPFSELLFMKETEMSEVEKTIKK